MSRLNKSYDSNAIEPAIAQEWIAQKQGASRVQHAQHEQPFTMVMPPPNITGILHMGHVLNATLQDVLARYHRMQGRETCWIPGLDHAAIATEAKLTELLASRGLDKWSIGREAFLQEAMDWKDKYGGKILDQLKRLGVSCDWERLRFTMDAEYSRAVRTAFVKLYEDGLIYRGYRLVNWCPASQSAISDEEVEHREVHGHLWYIRYPLVSGVGTLMIATTRPETLFGDVAVAVHPEDARYQAWIGQEVSLPLCDRTIPIIADTHVDKDFGSGAVKVTPAHDPNDYLIGERHALEMRSIFREDAHLNEHVPEAYRGMERYEARQTLVAQLDAEGFLVKTENHTHQVGYSQRGNVPIEPMLSEQWFIRMQPFVEPALEAVRSGKIRFYPSNHVKTYEHWLLNIQDWCVSRQLWWGHRIPVYTCEACGHEMAAVETPTACPKCQGVLHQEEDVLDTWASSWLWPFAVHEWPGSRGAPLPEGWERTCPNLAFYYPTTTVVTGPDILFFWVARMIMAGQYFMGQEPFASVYFTGLIRDAQGRKMSKSLGNSPDPMDIMEQYGADSLRYTMLWLAPTGNDILYSEDKLQLGRNFVNKLWNVAKFVERHMERVVEANGADCIADVMAWAGSLDQLRFQDVPLHRNPSRLDIWIGYQLEEFYSMGSADLQAFRFNAFAKTLYALFWNDFCDWYLEIAKGALFAGGDRAVQRLQMLLEVFHRILRLLHPLVPFVTEHIYQQLFQPDHSIMQAPWKIRYLFPLGPIPFMDEFQHILAEIRRQRAERQIPLQTIVRVRVTSRVVSYAKMFELNPHYREERNDAYEEWFPELWHMVKAEVEHAWVEDPRVTTKFVRTHVEILGAYHQEAQSNDARALETLSEEIERLSQEVKRLKQLLAGPFAQKASPDAVAKERERLADREDELRLAQGKYQALKAKQHASENEL